MISFPLLDPSTLEKSESGIRYKVEKAGRNTKKIAWHEMAIHLEHDKEDETVIVSVEDYKGDELENFNGVVMIRIDDETLEINVTDGKGTFHFENKTDQPIKVVASGEGMKGRSVYING